MRFAPEAKSVLFGKSASTCIKRRNLYFLSSYRPRQRAHECRGLALWCRCAASAQVVGGGVFTVGRRSFLSLAMSVGRAGVRWLLLSFFKMFLTKFLLFSSVSLSFFALVE